MEHNELKPCPYVEKIKSITGKEEFSCKTCPALECPFLEIKEEKKAIETWNRRANNGT